MRILIATTQVPFVRGGAEVHAEGLRDALAAAGHEAEIVAVPFKWYPPERLLDTMLACRLLDLTESCGTPVDRADRAEVSGVLHSASAQGAVDSASASRGLRSVGAPVVRPAPASQRRPGAGGDRAGGPPAASRSAGHLRQLGQRGRRLQRYCGIEAKPLYHPPPNAERYRCAEAADQYLFFPSRLNRAKRQELVLEALALTRHPVEVRFAGAADEAAYPEQLRRLAEAARGGSRAHWLGEISEDEKIEQYARAAGVLYPPLDEDYGYVTLEAMLAAKPVITCRDSGGPLEFVVSGETGFVTEPSAAGLAEAMDRLWENRACAQRLGQAARERYTGLRISWQNVVERLLA